MHISDTPVRWPAGQTDIDSDMQTHSHSEADEYVSSDGHGIPIMSPLFCVAFAATEQLYNTMQQQQPKENGC